MIDGTSLSLSGSEIAGVLFHATADDGLAMSSGEVKISYQPRSDQWH
jgi:hypothetical protein